MLGCFWYLIVLSVLLLVLLPLLNPMYGVHLGASTRKKAGQQLGLKAVRDYLANELRRHDLLGKATWAQVNNRRHPSSSVYLEIMKEASLKFPDVATMVKTSGPYKHQPQLEHYAMNQLRNARKGVGSDSSMESCPGPSHTNFVPALPVVTEGEREGQEVVLDKEQEQVPMGVEVGQQEGDVAAAPDSNAVVGVEADVVLKAPRGGAGRPKRQKRS